MGNFEIYQKKESGGMAFVNSLYLGRMRRNRTKTLIGIKVRWRISLEWGLEGRV